MNDVHTPDITGRRIRKFAKAGLGYMTYSLGLHRPLLGNRAVIVTFHRVTDSVRGNSINCPVAVFTDLCRFFQAHFSVLPLSELLARIRRRESVKDCLVITFDDGYKDNLEIAAPILLSFALPATFFVTTNFIGTDTVPFWDAADGVASQWMTWQDVRALLGMGFDIGGHTMNHPNLGSTNPREAAVEILGCRRRLVEELNQPVPHFAYPFGEPENITHEARQLVSDAGFECCLSCYGGTVTSQDDAYSLRRLPINAWIIASYQFGYELIQRTRHETRSPRRAAANDE